MRAYFKLLFMVTLNALLITSASISRAETATEAERVCAGSGFTTCEQVNEFRHKAVDRKYSPPDATVFTVADFTERLKNNIQDLPSKALEQLVQYYDKANPEKKQYMQMTLILGGGMTGPLLAVGSSLIVSLYGGALINSYMADAAAKTAEMFAIKFYSSGDIYKAKQTIVYNLKQFVHFAEEERRHDLEVISTELKRFSVKSISVKEVSKAWERFLQHMDQAARGLSESEIKKNLINNVIPDIKLSLPACRTMMANKTGEELLIFIQQVAYSVDSGKVRDDDFTPYLARMTLLYHLEGVIESNSKGVKKMTADEVTAYLNGLATQFRLKLLPAEANKLDSKKIWKQSIFHDGYVYGALFEMSKALFRMSFPSDMLGSLATDCSAMFEDACIKAGYPRSKTGTRLTTLDLASNRTNDSKLAKFFDSERLCSETQLQPGDGIVLLDGRRRHLQTFIGYEPASHGGLAMILIEATGQNNRNVRRVSKDIYENQKDCNHNNWESKPVYRYFLNSPSPKSMQRPVGASPASSVH